MVPWAVFVRKDPKFLVYDDWVDWLLPHIPVLDQDPLTYVLNTQYNLGIQQGPYISQQGLWMEFGVLNGVTINNMAGKTMGTVQGFDSFEGLPPDWNYGAPPGWPGTSRTMAKFAGNGADFNLKGKTPWLSKNVNLTKGYFSDSLPKFLKDLPPVGMVGSWVSLLHIDCDLYSSTRFVLEMLAPRIGRGTVIVFDELVNFPEYREHELKALFEWAEKYGHKFNPIGCMCNIDPKGVQFEGDGACLSVALQIY